MTRARRKPLDQDLYDAVKEEAKARFAVWPSAYASGWVVRTFKERGGRYAGGDKKTRSGLTKWFGEQWVDLSRPIYDEDGELTGYKPCGRKKSGDPADYPKCRPAREAMRMSPAEVKDAIKRKRAAEAAASKGRGGRGARAPVRVSTYKNPVLPSDLSCIDYDDDPDVFYHATPAENLSSILREGLKGGAGKTFKTQAWSKGKVFLAYGLNAGRQWQEAVYEMLFGPIALLAVTLSDAQKKALQPDRVARAEGDVCVYFLEASIAPEQIEVVDDGTGPRKNPSDDVFYHTTSFAFVDSIAASGLRPRRGAGVYSHGGYGEHSQGKVFLAGNKDAALAWYGKIQDMLWHEHSDDEEPDNLVPVMLRIALSGTTLQEEVDPLGDRDVPGSYFVDDVIPPDAIEFFDPSTKEWTPLEDWSADAYDGVESIEYFNDEGDVVDEDDTDEYGEQAWTSRGFTVYGPYDDGGFKPSQDDEQAWTDAPLKNPIVAPSTLAFRRWFAGSWVVDEQGQPLVVYRGEHGDTVIGGKAAPLLRSRMGSGVLSFTDRADLASHFALKRYQEGETPTPRLVPVFLRIKNPVITPDDVNGKKNYTVSTKLMVKRVGRAAVDKVFEENKEIVAALKDSDEPNPRLSPFMYLNNKHFVEAAKARGFDGALFPGNYDIVDVRFVEGKAPIVERMEFGICLEYRPFSVEQVWPALGFAPLSSVE